MSAMNVEQALENVYGAVNSDNTDLEEHITALKAALAAEGRREIVIDPARLVHNNRESRKLMQSFFHKRGVTVTFAEKKAG